MSFPERRNTVVQLPIDLPMPPAVIVSEYQPQILLKMSLYGNPNLVYDGRLDGERGTKDLRYDRSGTND